MKKSLLLALLPVFGWAASQEGPAPAATAQAAPAAIAQAERDRAAAQLRAAAQAERDRAAAEYRDKQLNTLKESEIYSKATPAEQARLIRLTGVRDTRTFLDENGFKIGGSRIW